MRGNIVIWSKKKQPIVARSSVEAEFQVLAQGVWEVMRIKILLKESNMEPQDRVKIYSDNKASKQ